MPSVDLSLIGKKSKPVVFEYTWKDVALYALGVGASSEELPFVYEGVPGGISVLPSFCVVSGYHAFPDLGADIEWSLMLHGEQTIRLHKPFPPQGKLTQVGEVAAIYDKGKGAVFHLKVTGKTEDGSPLYDAHWAIFYLGAGGFGGDPGPREEPSEPPEGAEPDVTMDAFQEFQGTVFQIRYPGDTLTTRCWVEQGRCLVNVSTPQGVVLKNGVCEFAEAVC